MRHRLEMTKAFRSGIHLGCMIVSKAQEKIDCLSDSFLSCVDFLSCNMQKEDKEDAVYFQDKVQQNRVLQKITQVIQKKSRFAVFPPASILILPIWAGFLKKYRIALQ